MKKAIISVSNKTNIVSFARSLTRLGYEIISTGGTLKTLMENDVPCQDIESFTHFPEILDGRVKTLHPKVHAGVLSLRNNPLHQETMKKLELDYIDLVCVNLYPFLETISKENVTFEEAIENIDIGGPSLLRSSAKNHQDVTVVCDPADYNQIIQEIEEHGNTLPSTRKKLAAKVFLLTQHYDSIIASYLNEEEFPAYLPTSFTYYQPLRYGENPHQKAAVYQNAFVENSGYSLLQAKILNGKMLSYNNLQDGNASINILREFENPTCVALKHMNPCGVSSSFDIHEAFEQAYLSDPVSIFGGIVAMNRNVDLLLAKRIVSIFLEIIIAPSYDSDALALLRTKKNLRVLELDMTDKTKSNYFITSINGGCLVQEEDKGMISEKELSFVTTLKPSEEEIQKALFAWKVCKHVKSNAIVITEGTQTIGVGAGQMNRIMAARIALEAASQQEKTNQVRVLASDAFFPFDDVVTLANEHEIKLIIQPGGSIRDQDSIDKCNQYGIKMIFTNMRHFKH